jgi:hypothetical protein
MAIIISQKDKEIQIQVSIKLEGSMMEMEENIMNACNEVGTLATQEALEQFDTDGSALKFGELKLTAKEKNNKIYQSPYGAVKLKRYIYQSSRGGKTYCPLEDKAQIIRGATPKFARQISHKYSNMNAPSVCADLKENHHRAISHSYVQEVTNWVGSIAQSKEEQWEYDNPKLEKAIKSIVLSLDGAYMLMRNDGYREAMVGNISFYDLEGERQHTIYLGEVPEHGKSTFFKRFETEIAKVKQQYPDALYIGIADGAKNNWKFLQQHTDRQLLDFYHVTEYLAEVSYAAYPTNNAKRETWLHTHCKQLKHEAGSVNQIISEMEKLSQKTSLTKKTMEKLSSALTYFKNHNNMMDYATHINEKLPIGSGVTEAACKTLVKQRLCASGMRWKEKGAKTILSLRALVQSKGRWQQFWLKIQQVGVQACI